MADSNANNENLSAANPAQSAPPSTESNSCAKGISSGVGGGTNTAFDINKLAAAAQQYNYINGIANEMFGYAVKWFRAVPQQRSKDVLFQEYTLSNVEECPIDVKVIVPAGNMPDSKYTYDLMGLEYEVPLEFQIDKHYWESKAGFGTAPQKKDIVYFTMANKLYQVESTYLFRGFMEQETAWKINLRKYTPEVSRRESEALKQTIDQYTVSVDEIFGTPIANDIKKLVDDTQFSAMNSTSQDKYKSIDTELKTVSSNLSVYGTIVAQSFYDMNSPIHYDAITYTAKDLIGLTSDRALMAWVAPKPLPDSTPMYDVNSITLVTMEPTDASIYGHVNYAISISTAKGYSDDIQIYDTIVITRPGALNFYAKVLGIATDPLVFYCFINPLVVESLNAIKLDWTTQTNYKLYGNEPISILDGVNDIGEHIFSVNIYANQYVAISYGHTYSNDDAYVIRLDDKLIDNTWYGLVVNIGNSWQQYSVYVWAKHATDKNAKLQNIFYETLSLYPEEIAVDEYTINKSNSFLTNIRLFSTTIEEEKQSNELLSYFTKDGDQIIISDNADPILGIPYITKAR